MGYGDSVLASGETIEYRARQHWLAPLADSLRPIVMVLLGLVLFLLVGGWLWPAIALVCAALIVVGLVWIAIVYFTWRAQEYLITNRRVLKVEGLLDKRSADSSLEKINDALLTQGLLARLLKYGDLEILTANEEAIDRYTMLRHAVDFKKAMLNAKFRLEDGGRVIRPAASAPAAPASSDVAAKLDQLSDLLAKGKITQADYDRKKADLLDKM